MNKENIFIKRKLDLLFRPQALKNKFRSYTFDNSCCHQN